MREYQDNGAKLGWLIDPQQKQIFVYRPHKTVQILESSVTLSDEEVLNGFILDLKPIWDVS